MENQIDNDQELLCALSNLKVSLLQNMSQMIYGQTMLLEEIIAAFFAGGHVLLTGVPGLGKTSIVRALAQIFSLKFSRIQFTPDLTPSDVIGSNILQEVRGAPRVFEFLPGPIFSNIVLADEINRTPPRTQSALLEAMQEEQVTVAGKGYAIEPPFFVMATQNPIEHEGTYLLPEAQLDRFLFSLSIDYPRAGDEVAMALATTGDRVEKCLPQVTRDVILSYQKLVRRVIVSESVAEYAVSIVRNTRPQTKNSPEITQQYVEWGAGPRATQAALLGAKAWAALDGRPAVSFQDIERVMPAVLRSRITLNYMALSDGMNVDLVVKKILREAKEKIS